MNKIFIIGNLTRDPELRTTAGDNPQSYCRFTVAVSRGKDNEADFFNVTVWNTRQAEACAQYLAKGRKVAVTGSLRLRKYEGSNGDSYSLDVNAEEVEFISYGKKEDDRS